jgi:hypothetical protein
MRFKYLLITSLIIPLFIVLSGCNDNSTSPVTPDNFSFSYFSSRDTTDHLANSLVLDTVKILLKDIKLNVANSNDSTNFKTGPYVIFLKLDTNITTLGSGYIPAGSYDKIKFEVHKLESNETVPDPEFRDSLGNNYSVVAKGFFNGNWFVYKSTKSAKQILNFPVVISLSAATVTNVTLLVRPLIWFIKNNDYMDPTNPANSNDIDNNIKDNINQNLKAFKDNDKNGIPDN